MKNWILAMFAIALVATIPLCADMNDAEDDEETIILTDIPTYGEDQEPAMYVLHAHFEYDEDGNLIDSNIDEEIPIYGTNYTEPSLGSFPAGKTTNCTYTTSFTVIFGQGGWGNASFNTVKMLSIAEVTELKKSFSGAKDPTNITLLTIPKSNAAKVGDQLQLTLPIRPEKVGDFAFTLYVKSMPSASSTNFAEDYFVFTGTGTATTWTLTLDPNGGSVSTTSKSVTFGSTYGTLPTPTRSGYTFDGWYTFEDGGTKVTSSTEVTKAEDHTIYAHWTLNAPSIKVTFNANNGSVSPSSITANAGSNITLPTPTRTGYNFSGWYTSKTSADRYGGGGDTYTIPSSTTTGFTMYAHWTAKTFTVTFNANGGSVSTTSKSVTYDSTYGTLPTPTRSGYTFDGWYTASSGGYLITSSSYVTNTSGHTLYAHWTETLIKVTFNANGGSCSIKSTSVPINGVVDLPTPTWANHEFQGWYSSASGGTRYGGAGGTYTVTESSDFTMYAQWKQIYTIAFNANGGTSVNSMTGTYQSTITLPSTEKTHYVFLGWYLNSTRVGGAGDSYTIVAGATLTAKWQGEPIDITVELGDYDYFKITEPDTYGSNKYTSDHTFTLEYGTELNVEWYKDTVTSGSSSYPDYCITKQTYDVCSVEGYNGNTSQDGVTITVSGTVSPTSEPVANTTYTYYSEAHYNVSGTSIPNTIGSGTNSTNIPNTLSSVELHRDGYRHIGWSEAEGATSGYALGAKVNLNKGVTEIYPVWVEQVTITYKLNGGTYNGTNPVTMDKGSTITLPTPTKTDYTFVGWYKGQTFAESDFMGEGGASLVVNSTMNLYAKYLSNTVTLIFHVENNEYEVEVTRGQVADLSSLDGNKTTRDGCEFYGWYTDPRCLGNSYDFSNVIGGTAETIEFYGIFETILEIDSVPAASAKVTYLSDSTFTFNITSTDKVSYVEWDFGDGKKSSSRDCFHAYGAPGTYQPTLTVYCGSESVTYSMGEVTVEGQNDIVRYIAIGAVIVIVGFFVVRRFI